MLKAIVRKWRKFCVGGIQNKLTRYIKEGTLIHFDVTKEVFVSFTVIKISLFRICNKKNLLNQKLLRKVDIMIFVKVLLQIIRNHDFTHILFF